MAAACSVSALSHILPAPHRRPHPAPAKRPTTTTAALTETLEARGVLGDVKARLRAEIFQALNDDVSCRCQLFPHDLATAVPPRQGLTSKPLDPRPQTESCPALSRENLLINELIREYLEYNKYKYTLSTMLAGEPHQPLLFISFSLSLCLLH